MQTTAFTASSTKPLYRATQVVWYILGLMEILLGFRFVLKAMGANAAAGFTNFIYSLTQPMAAPFLNVFRISHVEGSILEWTTLLAMAVYACLAYAILKLFVMSKVVSTPEAAIKLENQDR